MIGDYQQDNVKALQPKLQKYGIDFPNEINLTPFMLAVSTGAEKIMTYLINNGAKISITDNFGRNPFQLTILKAYLDPAYKQKVINRFYGFLKGESIKVKIDNRLIKIDSHQAEFLMLNYMIAVLRTHLITRINKSENAFFDGTNNSLAFQAIDFSNFFEGLAFNIVPEYRGKRTYISSILAKNEVNKDDKYNKKLFVRLAFGMYLPNPLLEVLIEEEWINIYDLIDIDEIEKSSPGYETGVLRQIKNYRMQLTANPDTKIDAAIYWNSI